MSDPMRTCDRCGSAVSAGAGTCPNCGAPLGSPLPHSEEAEYIVTDDLASLATRPAMKTDAPPPAPPPAAPQAGVATPAVSTSAAALRAPQKRSRWLWILSGCSIVALMICAGVIFLALYLVSY